MLVKLIALGLSPPVWKNVFHHVRTNLPQAPFAAAIFSTADEITYLQREYIPGQWRREEPDFLFSEAPAGRDWAERLRLLAGLCRLPEETRPRLVLALPTLDHGLRQLVQGPYPIRLILDNGSRFRIGDPALVLDAFPPGFPRVAVQEYVTRIKLRQNKGRADELSPLRLAEGAVLSLNDIEFVEQLGERMATEEWLRRVAKAEKLRLPRGLPLGLLREAKGLYLFPGVPADRVRGVCVGEVEFSHVVDMGQMTLQSAPFVAVLEAIQLAADRQAQRHQEFTRRLREAETKRDLPIVCGGRIQVLNEILAERLAAEGYQRLATLSAVQDDLFREPTLLIQPSSFDAPDFGVQVEPPAVFPIAAELTGALAELEGLPGLETVPYLPGERSQPLAEPELREQKGLVVSRGFRAREGRVLADKRLLLLRQEYAVLESAHQQLAALLEAKDSLLVWNGSLPAQVRQVLVFSHDQEEAGAVLHALSGVPKKRWFDLSPLTNAESIQGLSQAPLEEYRRDGLLVITASSRERLTDLRGRIEKDCAQAAGQVEEAEAALAFYQQEFDKAVSSQHALTRRWLRVAVQRWLERDRPRLDEQTAQVRQRHERQWLSRAMMHRILILSSSGENRPALLDACRQLYPGFSEEHSMVVPYDYEPLESLPQEQAEDVVRVAKGEGLDADQIRLRLEGALTEQNTIQFRHYLDVLAANLQPVLVDLVLIEHRTQVAGAILEFLRSHIPEFKDVPAVLVLPEYWAPPADSAMPWPLTRVAIVRRMGALGARECEQALLSIHPA
jgi:hypothetical protein